MREVTNGFCVLLDKSIPELRGEHVHFRAYSGDGEMCVALSRHEARKMAERVIRLLDTASGAEVVPMRSAF